MAEVDYGYGDQNDYGYGDASPDMGYGDASPDMGYGDASPDMGYGDASPDMGYGVAEPDMGYGAAEPDMGYGVAQPDMDYGYGDATPDEPVVEVVDKRPKRRCSVTKFSLATETPLTAASVINDLRMGLAVTPLPSATDDCAKSTVTDETRSLDYDKPTAPPECAPPLQQTAPKKNGMISRIRRRLSVVGN
jgi:hypothetical protein